MAFVNTTALNNRGRQLFSSQGKKPSRRNHNSVVTVVVTAFAATVFLMVSMSLYRSAKLLAEDSHTEDPQHTDYTFDPENAEPIYAIMITGKDSTHERLARLAMHCFHAQTYPNRHLLIINDGSYSLTKGGSDLSLGEVSQVDKIGHWSHQLLSRPTNPKHNVSVREVPVNRGPGLHLGALRNMALSLVPRGAVWVQWDDDDWRHEHCMQSQYIALRSARTIACALKQQIRYRFGDNSSWVRDDPQGIMGTLMVRNDHPNLVYPNQARSEDKVFYQGLEALGQTYVWPNDPAMYLRFIHGFNTWDSAHFERTWLDYWDLPTEESAAYLFRVVSAYQPIFSSFSSTKSTVMEILWYRYHRIALIEVLVVLVVVLLVTLTRRYLRQPCVRSVSPVSAASELVHEATLPDATSTPPPSGGSEPEAFHSTSPRSRVRSLLPLVPAVPSGCAGRFKGCNQIPGHGRSISLVYPNSEPTSPLTAAHLFASQALQAGCIFPRAEVHANVRVPTPPPPADSTPVAWSAWSSWSSWSSMQSLPASPTSNSSLLDQRCGHPSKMSPQHSSSQLAGEGPSNDLFSVSRNFNPTYGGRPLPRSCLAPHAYVPSPSSFVSTAFPKATHKRYCSEGDFVPNTFSRKLSPSISSPCIRLDQPFDPQCLPPALSSIDIVDAGMPHQLSL